jgi:hypothetical protein
MAVEVLLVTGQLIATTGLCHHKARQQLLLDRSPQLAYRFFMHLGGGSKSIGAKRCSPAMSTAARGGWVCVWVAALVAALVAVPALGSALDGGGGPAYSSLVLNRGAAASVAKTKPTTLRHDAAGNGRPAENEPGLSHESSRTPPDESTTASLDHRSLETRRGPPATPSA